MDFFGKIFEKMNQIDKLRIKEQFALKNLITSNADKIQQLEEDTQAMRKRLDMQ
jgi:cell shape-determining protein MreC